MSIKHKVRRLIERRLGVHIARVHFYSPIPALRDLAPEQSTRVNRCLGVDFRAESQKALIEELSRKYGSEYVPQKNPGLSKVGAFILYALIRSRRPKWIVEIGAGESSRISLEAVERNVSEGFPGRLTSIDPDPPDFLRSIEGPYFELISKRVQDIPEEFFREADILFIDSSHVSKFGSDVNYEVLSLVPQLKVGALVHWHDIMFPQDYPMDWIERGMYWNESYLVHAFMLYNEAFRILWAGRYMQVHEPPALQAAFPYLQPEHRLSSCWVERVG